jgi:hypothetical protein
LSGLPTFPGLAPWANFFRRSAAEQSTQIWVRPGRMQPPDLVFSLSLSFPSVAFFIFNFSFYMKLLTQKNLR